MQSEHTGVLSGAWSLSELKDRCLHTGLGGVLWCTARCGGYCTARCSGHWVERSVFHAGNMVYARSLL